MTCGVAGIFRTVATPMHSTSNRSASGTTLEVFSTVILFENVHVRTQTVTFTGLAKATATTSLWSSLVRPLRH